jgi:hypothetical protein
MQSHLHHAVIGKITLSTKRKIRLTSRVETGHRAFLVVAIQDDAAQAIRRI